MELITMRELEIRWSRCRSLLAAQIPDAEGMIVFSRLNIYYFTGTFGNGLFWLPLAGDPVLLTRRGQERAKIESPIRNIVPFNSYKDVEGALRGEGSPLGKSIAVEMT